jgi:hypothetical protein
LWRRRLAGVFAPSEGREIAGETPAPPRTHAHCWIADMHFTDSDCYEK